MKKLLGVLACLATWPAWAVDCTVGVYGGVPSVTSGPVQVALTLLDTFAASFTSTSTLADSNDDSSTTLPVAATLVRIKCSAKTHFLIGASPTATTADQSVEEETPEYFGVVGGTDKIAFIAGS